MRLLHTMRYYGLTSIRNIRSSFINTGVRFISFQRTAVPVKYGSRKISNNYETRRYDSGTAAFKGQDPQMMIAFTCKKCNTRSSHTFSKQAYTKGTVAIQCPGCKNRHLIADNLKIFKDNKFSLEQVLKARGENLTTTTEDLVFNDIPDSLKKTIGHYAKDAPDEYHQLVTNELPESNEVSENKKP